MLDARNIHRVVSRRVHDFSEEQLANLTTIVRLYRGQSDHYLDLVGRYLAETNSAASALPEIIAAIDTPLAALTQAFADWQQNIKGRDDLEEGTVETLQAMLDERSAAIGSLEADRSTDLAALKSWRISG